jgi:hypothetical protein
VVLDELDGGAVVVKLLETLDVATEEVTAGVEELPVEELEAGATAAVVDVELEWLLEPHATTSSAGASAKPIRFSIG